MRGYLALQKKEDKMSPKNIFFMAVVISFMVSLIFFAPAEQGLADQDEQQLVDNASIGPEFQISPTQNPDAHRFLPAVAYNSLQKQYLVVWHNQWSGSRDIYGQRLGSNGQLVGPDGARCSPAGCHLVGLDAAR